MGEWLKQTARAKDAKNAKGLARWSRNQLSSNPRNLGSLIGWAREEPTEVPELRIADGLLFARAAKHPAVASQSRDSPVSWPWNLAFLCFRVFFGFTRLAHADRNADVEEKRWKKSEQPHAIILAPVERRSGFSLSRWSAAFRDGTAIRSVSDWRQPEGIIAWIPRITLALFLDDRPLSGIDVHGSDWAGARRRGHASPLPAQRLLRSSRATRIFLLAHIGE
jgi:hypothetical protein